MKCGTFYVRYPEWGIGRVGDALPFQSQALEFDRVELESRRNPGPLPPGRASV